MGILSLLGAGNAGFTPYSFPNLTLWLDASDPATLFQDSSLTTPAAADNDPVGGWQDKSGRGNNVTGAGGVRPLLKLNILSGKPVLRYDGTDDALDGSSTSTFDIGTGDVAVFAVAKQVSAPAADGYILGNLVNGSPFDGFGVGMDTSGRYWGKTRDAASAQVQITDTTVRTNTFVVVTFVRTGGVNSLYINGTGVGTPAASTGSCGGDALTSGRARTGAASNYWKDDIAEKFVVVGPFNAALLLPGVRYLGAKWGITVA